jgi:hypothetical protein
MELKDKRVLVVGLGMSGVASALFLKAHGARVTVSDTKSGDELRNEIPVLLDHGITVETGGHGERTFRGQDLIVVSPGVPVDLPMLVQARSMGEAVIGEIELAALFLPGPICRDHRVERKDDDDYFDGRDFDGGWKADAGWREYRHSGDFADRAGEGGECDRAGGFELSVGDDSDVPTEGCRGVKRHARSSGPASDV